MSNVEKVLAEISKMPINELQIVERELSKRLSETKRVAEVFEKIAGKGRGVWTKEAQAFVNDLRDDV